ncbi:17952_t:CDS:2 [Funneliformis geosporum]|uniref:3895_t:CDS:1 n=1 Tax=Funneliformis geosporum TaxID=1117311 RepID=A0A9W4SGT9_9GLOM|nr:17952_t:CDS:2 [Funneliformis geosporum]CAI2168401.1 3895_t:CDS:2 [Funneliformis geosporum]
MSYDENLNVVVDILSVMTLKAFLPLFILTYGSKIIRMELKWRIYLLYVALIWVIILTWYENDPFLWDDENMISFNKMELIQQVTLILSSFLLICTIICHKNFGKGLRYYLEFDQELKYEYEASKLKFIDDEFDSESFLLIFWESVRKFFDFLNFLKEWLIDDQKQRSERKNNDIKVIIL